MKNESKFLLNFKEFVDWQHFNSKDKLRFQKTDQFTDSLIHFER